MIADMKVSEEMKEHLGLKLEEDLVRMTSDWENQRSVVASVPDDQKKATINRYRKNYRRNLEYDQWRNGGCWGCRLQQCGGRCSNEVYS